MRRAKRERRLLPFGAGLAVGYAATLALSAVVGLLLFLTDSAEGFSAVAAVIIQAVCAFLAGRTAGKLRRRGGLKTGLLCGVMYFAPFAVVAVVWGTFGGALLWIKLALCIIFGTAGGVSGVNL